MSSCDCWRQRTWDTNCYLPTNREGPQFKYHSWRERELSCEHVVSPDPATHQSCRTEQLQRLKAKPDNHDTVPASQYVFSRASVVSVAFPASHAVPSRYEVPNNRLWGEGTNTNHPDSQRTQLLTLEGLILVQIKIIWNVNFTLSYNGACL